MPLINPRIMASYNLLQIHGLERNFVPTSMLHYPLTANTPHPFDPKSLFLAKTQKSHEKSLQILHRLKLEASRYGYKSDWSAILADCLSPKTGIRATKVALRVTQDTVAGVRWGSKFWPRCVPAPPLSPHGEQGVKTALPPKDVGFQIPHWKTLE